jgi:hypothetical protein
MVDSAEKYGVVIPLLNQYKNILNKFGKGYYVIMKASI